MRDSRAEAITLEKGVPLPVGRDSSGLSKAIAAMQIGDSFRAKKTLYGTVRTMASNSRISIKTRTEDDGAYMRVWRIA